MIDLIYYLWVIKNYKIILSIHVERSLSLTVIGFWSVSVAGFFWLGSGIRGGRVGPVGLGHLGSRVVRMEKIIVTVILIKNI